MLFFALGTALLLIGADQLTKWLITQNFHLGQTLNLININGNEVLNFSYYQNTGAAFSILEGKRFFLSLVVTVFLLVILFLLFSKKIKSPWMVWSCALILAGGTGNLIDRLVHGYVIDFIDVRLIQFAIFNVADICAVSGSIMLFLSFVFQEYQTWKKTKREKAAPALVTGENITGEDTSAANEPEAEPAAEPDTDSTHENP